MADLSSYTHKFRATGDSFYQNGANKISKRNRQPVSCSPCRSRKLKCDRGHPCETCVKRGDEDGCCYGGGAGKPSAQASKQHDESNSRRTKAQDRLQHLERLVMQMMNTSDSSNSLSRTASLSTAPSSVESTRGPTDESVHSVEIGQGHFRVEGDEARYVGSTHWSAILDNINELKSAIVSEQIPVDSEENERDAANVDTLFGTGKPPSVDRILQQYLPTRVQVDRRLAGYFNAKYMVLPIIHTYEWQRQYEQFWNDPLGTPPLWLSIMFSIMCMSATLSQAVGAEQNTPGGGPTPRDGFLTAAAQCLALGGYTRPKRFVVEALMLFAQCKYMATLDPSREVGLIFSIITRLAFRMGYHRDPDNFSHFSKFEGEMRRRTWATCKQFDLMVSFQLGLPNNIPPDSYDTKSPRNLLDADFDEHMAEMPPSRPETEATQILYFVVKSRMMDIFSKVCRHALSFEAYPENSVSALDAEVRQAYSTVPEPLRIRPMAQSFADPGHLIMVRLNCEFLFQKSICVLHRKYMAQGNEASRNACVTAALAILGHLIDLHKELQPGGQLYADRWMLSSFTMNDFLLAAMVLCLALSMSQKRRQPTASNLQESRLHLGLLRQAHVICLEMGTGAKEAKRVADALGIMLSKLEPTLGSGFIQEPTISFAKQTPPDFVLTPLSLEEANTPQPQMQAPRQSNVDAAFATTTGNFGLFDQFDNLIGGMDDIDFTAFDQYLGDSNDLNDIGQGWTSTPYRFLGQTRTTPASTGF